jgi:hypothetical protein
MKMVIDIPEDVYKRTVFYREFRDLSDCVATIKALEKATPLSKGHGRLIDADAYKEVWFNSRQFEPMLLLDETPTVIKADKEVQE